MLSPRQQFRVLYRDALVRLIDLELISAQGDASTLFAQLGALLGALSVVLAVYIIPRYSFSGLASSRLAILATGDQEFLIATTMAVVGVFAVVSWHAVFPDRRDIAVLATLPVRTRTIFLARVAAIATGLGLSVLAVNGVIGLSYPFVAIAPGSGTWGGLRSFAAYWITMSAAGAFVFCSLLAIQGVAAQVLSYRLFLRASNFLQIGAFFAILAGYFLTPGASDLSITEPANESLMLRFPSFWFLGLFQELNGPVHPVFAPLATKAVYGLLLAVSIALAAYALAYYRNIRRVIEQPDIASGDRSPPLARPVIYLLTKFAPKPLERAILLFAVRTVARSRQHRTILAAYSGIGLAISLTYAKIFLYGNSSLWAPMRGSISVPRWYELNVPLMAAGSVMLFFVILGTRAVYSLPVALKANWVFKITAVHSPKSYFAAVRKSLYVLAACPIWLAITIVYFVIWPPQPVIAHLTILAVAAVILVDRSMFEFRKIPFACSYLPGKSDLKRKLVIYGVLFMVVTDLGSRIEYWAISGTSRYIVLLAILTAVAFRARSRWTEFAGASYHRVQFDEFVDPEVSPLDLRRDGAWGVEKYIDEGDPTTVRPWAQRIKTGALKTAYTMVILAAIGAVYEQASQWWQDRYLASKRIGRSVDIGGRSLNIFCSGGQGPTVIFESGAGGPGIGWAYVQREVARFTGACWYDRAGYGWSDSGPFPRDAAAIARDLHVLLQKAQVPPPYVLVGASLGGFAVLVSGGLYPDEIAGVVLADSSHMDEWDSIPPAGVWNPSLSFYRARSVFAQVLRRIGLLRVLMDSSPGEPPKGLTQDEWKLSRSFEPRTLAENAKELFLESARQARAMGQLGSRPLIVLTAGLPSREAHNPSEAKEALLQQKKWIEIQAQLARRSFKGKQIVVKDSRHRIQGDNPQAIVNAVREVVDIVRTKL